MDRTLDFEDLVLTAPTAALGDEAAARGTADAVEFRMDLATDPLDQLAAYDGELPLIATNRAEWEGGDAPDDPSRLEALGTAADHDAVAAIDIELRSVEAGDADTLLEHAADRGVAVIVSVHDFDRTPSEATLVDLLRRACEHGAVGKLAVTAAGPDDVLDVLSATRTLVDEGQRVATMCMGASGRHSRAIAPLYGSCIAYAPVDPARATAPGQYDLATLRSLIEQLRAED
ncbi:MAG: type I 3-dehydroquinate dehydratase [Halobacteriales archaeon]